MQNVRNSETLKTMTDMFRRGIFAGAVTGAVLGLAPGVLLILVLTGGSYHIDGAEVLGFIIMCIALGAVLGGGLGGVCSLIVRSVARAIVARVPGRQ